MKKLLPFLCASALALSLTACAGAAGTDAGASSDVTFTFTDGGVTGAGDSTGWYLHRLRQLRGRLHQGEKEHDRRDAGAGRPDTYE